DVDPGLPFGQFLDQVRATVLDAGAHDEVPFEKVVEALRPDRDPGRIPLVQVMIALHNMPTGEVEQLGECLVEALPVPWTAVFCDLALQFEEAGGALRVLIEYSTDLFDGSTVERLAGHLRVLCERVAVDPGVSLGRLGMLPEGEYEQVVRG